MNNPNKTIEETKLYMDLHDKLKSMKFSGMAEELRHQISQFGSPVLPGSIQRSCHGGMDTEI